MIELEIHDEYEWWWCLMPQPPHAIQGKKTKTVNCSYISLSSLTETTASPASPPITSLVLMKPSSVFLNPAAQIIDNGVFPLDEETHPT